MNATRLLHMIEILKAVEANRKPFDMSDWFEDNNFPENCNTAACAWGWAARDPVFRAEGVYIKDADACFGKECGFPAIASFFHISYADAYFIFNAGRLVPPSAVIQQIRHVMAGNNARDYAGP
jgi:hypothetical protein